MSNEISLHEIKKILIEGKAKEKTVRRNVGRPPTLPARDVHSDDSSDEDEQDTSRVRKLCEVLVDEKMDSGKMNKSEKKLIIDKAAEMIDKLVPVAIEMSKKLIKQNSEHVTVRATLKATEENAKDDGKKATENDKTLKSTVSSTRFLSSSPPSTSNERQAVGNNASETSSERRDIASPSSVASSKESSDNGEKFEVKKNKKSINSIVARLSSRVNAGHAIVESEQEPPKKDAPGKSGKDSEKRVELEETKPTTSKAAAGINKTNEQKDANDAKSSKTSMVSNTNNEGERIKQVDKKQGENKATTAPPESQANTTEGSSMNHQHQRGKNSAKTQSSSKVVSESEREVRGKKVEVNTARNDNSGQNSSNRGAQSNQNGDTNNSPAVGQNSPNGIANKIQSMRQHQGTSSVNPMRNNAENLNNVQVLVQPVRNAESSPPNEEINLPNIMEPAPRNANRIDLGIMPFPRPMQRFRIDLNERGDVAFNPRGDVVLNGRGARNNREVEVRFEINRVAAAVPPIINIRAIGPPQIRNNNEPAAPPLVFNQAAAGRAAEARAAEDERARAQAAREAAAREPSAAVVAAAVAEAMAKEIKIEPEDDYHNDVNANNDSGRNSGERGVAGLPVREELRNGDSSDHSNGSSDHSNGSSDHSMDVTYEACYERSANILKNLLTRPYWSEVLEQRNVWPLSYYPQPMRGVTEAMMTQSMQHIFGDKFDSLFSEHLTAQEEFKTKMYLNKRRYYRSFASYPCINSANDEELQAGCLDKESDIVKYRNGMTMDVAHRTTALYLERDHKLQLQNMKNFRAGSTVWIKYDSVYWPAYVIGLEPYDPQNRGHPKITIDEDNNEYDEMIIHVKYTDGQRGYNKVRDVENFMLSFPVRFDPAKSSQDYVNSVVQIIAATGETGYFEDFLNVPVYEGLKNAGFSLDYMLPFHKLRCTNPLQVSGLPDPLVLQEVRYIWEENQKNGINSADFEYPLIEFETPVTTKKRGKKTLSTCEKVFLHNIELAHFLSSVDFNNKEYRMLPLVKQPTEWVRKFHILIKRRMMSMSTTFPKYKGLPLAESNVFKKREVSEFNCCSVGTYVRHEYPHAKFLLPKIDEEKRDVIYCEIGRNWTDNNPILMANVKAELSKALKTIEHHAAALIHNYIDEKIGNPNAPKPILHWPEQLDRWCQQFRADGVCEKILDLTFEERVTVHPIQGNNRQADVPSTSGGSVPSTSRGSVSSTSRGPANEQIPEKESGEGNSTSSGEQAIKPKTGAKRGRPSNLELAKRMKK